MRFGAGDAFRRAAAAIGAAVALALSHAALATAATIPADPAPPSPPCGTLASSFDPAVPPVYTHVVVIMDENLGFNGWFGSAAAPYTNSLAAQCALATNMTAATHPSQPNYVALTSGILQVWNGTDQHSDADNLFHQLDAAGSSWLALEEGMARPCAPGTSGVYKNGHNPAVWYDDLGPAGDGSCATDDVGFSPATFDPTTLPAFTWITPDLCDDMHWQPGCPGTSDASVQAGDTWLAGLLPAIFATPDYQAGKTIVLITWDEGDEATPKGIDCTVQTDIDATGCHVGLIAASAYLTPGTQDATRYTPYSTLAAIETMDALPLLGQSQTATPLGPGMGF
ncbi:MAG TPA: alkaline phosphatase family protein [Gaiellales bacterium]